MGQMGRGVVCHKRNVDPSKVRALATMRQCGSVVKGLSAAGRLPGFESEHPCLS